MKIDTKLTKVSRDVKKQKGFINPGIYKGSTMIFNSFEDYIDDINNDDDRSTLYGINKNPSVEQLEKAISSLYKCNDTIIAPSGLAALIIPFLTYLKKDDEVLINDTVYSPTRTFCEKILKNYRVKIKYFHPLKDLNKFEKLITNKTKLIYLESPGTATFEILDIPKITKIAKKKKIPTVMDNTWSSPLFCNPIKLGINIIIDAGTKYINGHSDVLIGFVSSDKKHSKEIRITAKTLGMCPGSEEVYLALRGIPTLNLRMKQIETNTLIMANKLLEHSLIDKVYHPALQSFPNHNIWKRDFTGSTGLFSFSLKKFYPQSKIKKMFSKISIFKLGYSWGGYDSLITFPPLSKRKFKTLLKGNLIRVYCGLEDSSDQIKDIINSLKTLK